jgi:hypothetical protein
MGVDGIDCCSSDDCGGTGACIANQQCTFDNLCTCTQATINPPSTSIFLALLFTSENGSGVDVAISQCMEQGDDGLAKTLQIWFKIQYPP